eukprot:6088171-Heterocapsa_arctica.AAC.1
MLFPDGTTIPLLAQEDNSQCIAAVKNGYSANLRHMGRVQRTCIGSLHEAFAQASRKTSLQGIWTHNLI